MKKLAIMQPYFLPYIGYFQLINAVDEFVVYDNIEFTKKGWINRNRYLCERKDKLFSLQLEKDSDFLNVCERKLSASFEKNKLLNQIYQAYRRAVFFEPVYKLFESIIVNEERNLFNYIHFSIIEIVKYLDIKTKIVVSSNVDIDHTLRSTQKVISICKALNADEYYNSIGGIGLYDKNEFEKLGLTLKFLKVSEYLRYKQFNDEFVPNLSILDVMMFNSVEQIKEMLNNYELL